MHLKLRPTPETTAVRAMRLAVQSLTTVILGLCIALLLTYELWRSYSQAREDAESNVLNLVHFMSEQVARTLQSVDVNLQGIAGELERNPALPDNDPDVRAHLHKRLAAMPFVRALFVAGADGHVSHSTDFPDTSRINLADQEYFKIHRDDPSMELYFSKPLKSDSLDFWFISMSRPIENGDGSFAGVVVAAVEPLYFESFYRRLLVGGGTAALFLDDGTLIARTPVDARAMGKSFSNIKPFLELPSPDTPGVNWYKSQLDGISRVAGYQWLASAPVVALVALNEDEVMRPWRSHALVALVGAVILLSLLAVLEWLTRRNRRREETARMRLEKTQRLEALGRFAGGIAHDCGNFMRIIRSATIVLRPLVDDRKEAVRLLDEIDVTLDAGRALVNRLLTYARNPEIHLEIVDLRDLVTETWPLARQAAGPGVEVMVTLSRKAAPCRVDKAQFQAAIINLVLNARDAMPSGGAITIDVRRRQNIAASDWVDVTVEDNGIGMTEDIRRQAFDPFFTVKEDGAGHGMGLSQVQEFVRQSGGRIEISSDMGEGTRVRIRLPLESRYEDKVQFADLEKHAPARSGTGRSDGGIG